MLKLRQASRCKLFSIQNSKESKRLVNEKRVKAYFSFIETEKALSIVYQDINTSMKALKNAIRVLKVQGSPLGFSPPSSL